MAVNIEWVGHACFRIWRDGGPVIVTDPFSPTRLGLPAGSAIQGDLAICYGGPAGCAPWVTS